MDAYDFTALGIEFTLQDEDQKRQAAEAKLASGN